MPCYLFTWHAYATWMPDRQQGYVKKGHGILPSDLLAAQRYRALQKEPAASFDEPVQRLMIEEAIVTADMRRFRLHGVAAESTHLHVLISWSDHRSFTVLRRGLRESISRRLNSQLKRRWLEAGGSRKQVRERRHFAYLMNVYLPKHNGVKWSEGVGYY